MPIARLWAYFDHAAVAPLPDPTRKTLADWAIEAAEQGDTAWPRWAERLQVVRQLAAELLNAHETELALVANTTTGINIVAEGFPWHSGDNVVVLANEFPSNLYPWLNLASRGVQARVVPVDVRVDPNAIWDACDRRTRLIAISWVGFGAGYRVDIDAIVAEAHRRGVQVLLDAIQGLGVFPIDVSRTAIDYLAADGHKWLLGPEGAGLLYIRESHLEELRPVGVGWHSVKRAFDFSHIEPDWRHAASRFEGGSHNMAGFLALGSSLELLRQFGAGPNSSTIADRVLAFTELACERLTAIGGELLSIRDDRHRSGIVLFQMPGQDPAELRRRCLSLGVALSCRQGALRISPHAYNDESDLDRLISALAST